MKLYNLVRRQRHAARFHTPGHSGKNLDGGIFACAKYDVTELPHTDNLQSPSGIILEAERRAAEVYGVDTALFFTSGATTAVFTALAAAAEQCDRVYLHGAAHKSFKNGARLAGLTVIPKPDKDAAAFVTSPDYFGVCEDRETLGKLAQNAKLLIVDAAHGAHYAFSARFPKPPWDIADMTVISPHKTMPVLTGGAVLLIREALEALPILLRQGGNAVTEGVTSKGCSDRSPAGNSAVTTLPAMSSKINIASGGSPSARCRADLHTTSPSYPVLASLDYAINTFADKGAKLYERVFAAVERFKRGLMESGFEFYDNDDFTRLVIKGGFSSNKPYCELEQDGYTVYIVTPYNYKYLPRLKRRLIQMKGAG